MHFSKVKLSGFKSFVDPVELIIDQGITGIVGPNGCGKSNVIEALRWAMGETSAKRMRGGEMDDVIFGGSSNRPARNIAEVSVFLDNAEGGAPSPFDTASELEITRRIERGAGSNYRINGKEMRARDVQLLFADMATGANSTAIVSQGRIGAIIGAKPTEQRTLLEEAAGIRGLHSRRHEAELRLRGAETNLERLDDVIGALESQHQGLQRQSRQANRYRRLSDHIRRHEAILLHLRWMEANAALASAREKLSQGEDFVRARAEEAASAASRQANAAANLPQLRDADAKAAAALQTLRLAMRDLDNEEARIVEAIEALTSQLQQVADDGEREKALFDDAKGALERLDHEKAEIESAREAEAEKLAEAEAEAETASEAVEKAENDLSQLTEEVAGVEAQRNALRRRISESQARITQIEARLNQLNENEARLRQENDALGEIEAAEERVAQAEAALSEARTRAESGEASLAEMRQAEAEARNAFSELEAELRNGLEETLRNGRETVAALEEAARTEINEIETAYRALDGEMRALKAMLAGPEEELDAAYQPLIDALKVKPGYEAALGAAFGEELDASTDTGSPIHWTDLPPLAGAMGLPGGAEVMTKFVDGPSALSRRLSQIGVVADAAEGEALQGALGPGQRLVSKEGGLWRWDGFTIAAGTPTAAARRLEQKNRLAEIEVEHAALETRLNDTKASTEARINAAKADAEAAGQQARNAMDQALADAKQKSEEASDSAEQAAAISRQLAQTVQQSFNAVNQARQTQASMAGKAADLRSRLEGIAENRLGSEADLSEATDQVSSAEAAMAVLEDPVSARERVNRLRASVAELRSALIDRRGLKESLERDAANRQQRLETIDQEKASWSGRIGGADQRVRDLEERAAMAEATRAELVNRPAEINEQRAALNDKIAFAEATRNTAADALAEGEKEQAEADKALREAEAAVASAREDRVRRESDVEQATQTANTVRERIAETLECEPEKVLEAGGIEEDEELPPRADVEHRLERLQRERGNMGAVNLRAEQEARELEEQITSMQTEREDLLAAIARLRQGINALNREGRERLLAAFEQVNTHFSELFTRLFGGGEARLALTEAEDPLQAGLEIMASPPGKRMQIMSLLSGGEQALTALALLFGVFLTNPAPICVLDEVDAPLDDSNVDRFCTLLDEIAQQGTTRFLVVTHHRLTMARVDRLFGVTMAERGVSQLVSVDLREAARLKEPA